MQKIRSLLLALLALSWLAGVAAGTLSPSPALAMNPTVSVKVNASSSYSPPPPP
jgi:hypothetical protein